MKEFNLEEAKAGKPVCTRGGLPVRIVCFNRKSEDYPIVALIDVDNIEYVEEFTKEGFYYICLDKTDEDLMMVENET